MSDDSPAGKNPALEAANWLVVLAEEPVAEAVRMDFQEWFDASPENRKAWQAATETYDLIGYAPRRRTGPHKVASSARPRRVGRQHRMLSKRALFAAAVAACLIVVAAPSVWLRLSADRVTDTAELATMKLNDGSTIQLGPDSAVKVAYGANERRVVLLAGEASFHVKANPARPFRVEAGFVRTTVLGTAFEVRRERSGTWVAVAHGRVRVNSTDGRVPIRRDLRDGDWLRVDDDRHVEHGPGIASPTPPDRTTVVVKNRPVAEVIDRLRPWYGGTIIVTDPKMSRQRVTGAYDPRDPAKALTLLLSAHGGTVRQVTPWVLLVSTAGS